jgi:hypothetical protein
VEPLGVGATALPPPLGVIAAVVDGGLTAGELVTAVVLCDVVVVLVLPDGGVSTAAPVVGTAN